MEIDVSEYGNYIRADMLEVNSLEFFFVICAFLIFLFRTRRGLIEAYIVAIPFSDKVYRMFDLQPADFIGILIVCVYYKRVFGLLKEIYLLVPLLVFGSVVSFIVYDDSFGALYSARVLVVFLVANILSANLYFRNKVQPLTTERYVKLYKLMVYFSVGAITLQITCWLMGFSVNGIFYQPGLIRAKGLAHEPSTFAIWLALAAPLIFSFSHHLKIKVDVKLFLAIMLGMLLTFSISAIIGLAVFFFLSMIYFWQYSRKLLFKFMSGFALLGLLTAPISYPVFSDVVFPKVADHLLELTSSDYKADTGRGGDRLLFDYLNDSPYLGIGAYRSSRLQSEEEIARMLDRVDYISASNIVITTLAEFGYIGGGVFLSIFFGWILYLSRYKTKYNNFYYYSTLSWVIVLLGMRVFAFHQPWFNVALFRAMAAEKEKNQLKSDLERTC